MRVFFLLARFPSTAFNTGAFIVDGYLERQNAVSCVQHPGLVLLTNAPRKRTPSEGKEFTAPGVPAISPELVRGVFGGVLEREHDWVGDPKIVF